jgi:hypothetical protein
MREGIKNFKESLSEPDEINVTPKKGKDTSGGREGEKDKHSLPEKREQRKP